MLLLFIFSPSDISRHRPETNRGNLRLIDRTSNTRRYARTLVCLSDNCCSGSTSALGFRQIRNYKIEAPTLLHSHSHRLYRMLGCLRPCHIGVIKVDTSESTSPTKSRRVPKTPRHIQGLEIIRSATGPRNFCCRRTFLTIRTRAEGPSRRRRRG